MSVAASAVRPGLPSVDEDALERALSDVASLRADLARRVAAAASDAVADAGEADRDREDGPVVDDSDAPDPSASVDQLVTRLRALHGARDACVSQMRLEGSIREADAAASALEAISPDALVESPAEALERLEAGVEALRAAARALAADRDEEAVEEAAEAEKRRRKSGGSAREAPPKAPRFARVAALRVHALATRRLRRFATALFANAAASSGWPCDLDRNALSDFEWALARGDETTDREKNDGLRRSFAACATLRAVAAAAAETFAETDDGVAIVSPPEKEKSMSWAGEALASPVAARLRRLFSPEEKNGDAKENDFFLADPSRPELLFACASRAIAGLAPLVCETLESLDAFGEKKEKEGRRHATRGFSARIEARNASVAFAESVAASAASLVASRYLPACAAAEEASADEEKKAKKMGSRGGGTSASVLFSSVSVEFVGRRRTNGASNDENAERREAARLDVPWLHLADECASFDDAVRKTIREALTKKSYVGLPASSSALARLASTDRVWCERWFTAELGDAARALAETCDAPGDAGWVPAGIGGDAESPRYDAENDSETAFETLRPDVPVALPAADAACDALRRATARALAIPADARVARDGLGDLVGRFYGVSQKKTENVSEDASVSENVVSAREAFLASVAFPLAEAFARRCATRADADDAFGSLAVGDGVQGMVKIGRCVSAATRVALFLKETAESAEVVAGFSVEKNVFFEQISTLERHADRLTDVLVDAAFGAYAAKCAHYEHGAHLLTFGDDDGESPTAIHRDSDGEKKTDLSFVCPSALFGAPLETLRERLVGLRRALDRGEDHAGQRTNAAIRTVARLAARRLLQNVVLATHKNVFSTLGAARFAADVSALLAVFTAARARRPAACLVEIIEASALLNLDVREAARVATACGAAEAAAAAAEENEREANDADEKRKDDAAAAARAAAAAAREAVGVFVLDDAVAFAVLSRRADLGAKKGT